jgi:hypothetical protein
LTAYPKREHFLSYLFIYSPFRFVCEQQHQPAIMHDVSGAMDGISDRGFEACRALTERIYAALDSDVEDLDIYVAPARSAINTLDHTLFMSDPTRIDDQVWLITALQRLAYYDPDSGGFRDVAEWCVTQWLKIVQSHPENLSALQGLCHN